VYNNDYFIDLSETLSVYQQQSPDPATHVPRLATT